MRDLSKYQGIFPAFYACYDRDGKVSAPAVRALAKFLLDKGVPTGDVDYYAFKIGKLVTDTTDFEKAAEQFLKEHAPQEPAKPPVVSA